MLPRKRNFLFLVIALIMMSGFIFILRQENPAKPAEIPEGDYSYTIEYAKHRIQQVMEEKHL